MNGIKNSQCISKPTKVIQGEIVQLHSLQLDNYLQRNTKQRNCSDLTLS